MDFINDWASFIPPQARSLVLQPSTLASFAAQGYAFCQSTAASAYGLVDSLSSNILTSPNGRPSISIDGKQSIDLVSVAFLILILLLSLKAIDMLRRVIWSWIVFFVKLAMWASIVSVALYIYSRGTEGVTQDVKGAFEVYQAHRAFWEDYVDNVNRARREAGVLR